MSAGAAWLAALLKDRKPAEKIGLRRVRDGRYALGHKGGRVVTAWSVYPFGSVVDLRHVVEHFSGGDVGRCYVERRATLRAVLASGEPWELVMIPDPVPVALGTVCEKRSRKRGGLGAGSAPR